MEISTAFLLLAGAAVVLKTLSDAWIRLSRTRPARPEGWASVASRFAEPASFLALLAGVVGSSAFLLAGSRSWPADGPVASQALSGEALLLGLSQTAFLGAVFLRLRYGPQTWSRPRTAVAFAALVLGGDAILAFQTPFAAHLAWRGSLLGDFLLPAGVTPAGLGVLPLWTFVLFLIGLAFAGIVLRRRRRSPDRESARLEMARLAGDVKVLLECAKQAGLPVDVHKRRIARAVAAARGKHYGRALRLIGVAKRGLEASVAGPSGDGVGSPADVIAEIFEPPDEDVPFSPAARVAAAPIASVAVASQGAETVGRGNLAAAVELAERSRGTFDEDALVVVQLELAKAREALLDLKAEGQDLSGPIGMLKAANVHVLNEEWDDALRCLREFRREIDEL